MKNRKDILGKTFFTLSVLFLAYTLVTPLNHRVCQIDEYFTMTVTNLPVQDIITVTAGDVHPPLYYFMAKAVAEMSRAFNLNVLFNLKLLTILAFAIILVITATTIRKRYCWLTAGLFAISLSVMSEFSRYHLIARMYGWMVLFILIAFLAFENIINDRDVKKSWIVLTLSSVLAAYTHYFAAITAICIYIILLIWLIKNKKDQIRGWAISAAAGIVLYIPWAFVVVSQLMKIKEGYIYSAITLEDFIIFLGYYAYNETAVFSVIAIAFFIAIMAIYLRQTDCFSKQDRTMILTAIAAYLGTLLIAVVVSQLLNPILDGRYLMPVAAMLWLAISIILGKIKNNRLFLIALGLVAILLVCGVAYSAITFDNNYHEGLLEKEYFDNITNDNNSVLIIGTENDLMFFLCCSKGVDTYCLNVSDVFSLPSAELHRQYDYKDINETQIDEFISNNTDKNIYFMYWNKTAVKSPIENEFIYLIMHYTKIDTKAVEAKKSGD